MASTYGLLNTFIVFTCFLLGKSLKKLKWKFELTITMMSRYDDMMLWHCKRKGLCHARIENLVKNWGRLCQYFFDTHGFLPSHMLPTQMTLPYLPTRSNKGLSRRRISVAFDTTMNPFSLLRARKKKDKAIQPWKVKLTHSWIPS